VSMLEAVLIAALIIYSLFLAAILVEYITDKRGKKKGSSARAMEKESQEISAPRGSEKEKLSQAPGLETPEKDGAPEQWKTEEFE